MSETALGWLRQVFVPLVVVLMGQGLCPPGCELSHPARSSSSVSGARQPACKMHGLLSGKATVGRSVAHSSCSVSLLVHLYSQLCRMLTTTAVPVSHFFGLSE